MKSVFNQLIKQVMEYSYEILYKRLYLFKTYSSSSHLHNSIRKPNFPEDISENIVKLFLNCEKITPGDLFSKEFGKIELKCFSSRGPISFGPKEKWDTLMVLDATQYFKDSYILYIINISSDIFDIKINKHQTYKDQINQKRRPRISWDKLKIYSKNHSKIFNIRLDKISTIGTVTEFPANL